MSDCFNHMVDAFDRIDCEIEDDFNHVKVKIVFDAIKKQTEKAVCFCSKNKDFWFPKNVIEFRQLDTGVEVVFESWFLDKKFPELNLAGYGQGDICYA